MHTSGERLYARSRSVVPHQPSTQTYRLQQSVPAASTRSDAGPNDYQFIYDQIRKEILQNQQAGLLIFQFTLTLVGAIFAFAMSNAVTSDLVRYVLVLAAGVMVASFAYRATDLDNANLLMGTYLRLAVERSLPRPFQWERTLYEIRHDVRVSTPNPLDVLIHGRFRTSGFVHYLAMSTMLWLADCVFLLNDPTALPSAIPLTVGLLMPAIPVVFIVWLAAVHHNPDRICKRYGKSILRAIALRPASAGGMH